MDLRSFEVPRSIDAGLLRLRQMVRRYVLIEGLAIVVVLFGVGFWLSYGADELHFQWRRLELPRWLRITFTISLAVIVTLAFLTWVLGRLWRSFGRRVLALILERRFPQLGDRLITAIELQGEPRAHDSPVSQAMFERTAAEAAIAVQNLDLNQVFDPRPLKRAVTVAGVILASLIGMSVANAAGVERWFHAFILGQEDYWEPYRRSSMSVHVIAQPGDRVREFDPSGEYRHPRGADLTIEAVSAEGRPAPERAELRFRSFGAEGSSSRGSTPMSRRGDRVFRQTLGRVIEEQHLWVVAGDYINRMPLRVLIVEPPKLDSLEMRCDYPGYTGLDSLEDRPVPVQSVQASLPMETEFTLEGKANKPLVSVLVRSELFELRFNREKSGGVLTIRETPQSAPKTINIASGKRWILSEGDRFSIPLAIAAKGMERLLTLKDGAAGPIPLPPIVPLQIYLEDEDGIFSTDPTLLTISGIPDLDPVVDVRLKGVGNVVTRLAEIPVRGTITDDYGVAKAEFGYEVQTPAAEGDPPAAPDDLKIASLRAMPAGQKEFRLGGDIGSERFALTPLELRDGQKLHIAVYAEDGDDRNGPHRAHGELFTFTIVPAEELLARLYEKELNLRQRFEQIILETKRLRSDLVEQRGRTDEWNSAKQAAGAAAAEDPKVRELLNAIDASARRSVHQIRTNQTESRAIEVAFGEVREEMVNNRVDTESLLERIDRGVLAPLHTINESDYPDVDGKLALFALALERGQDPAAAIDASREAIDAMLVRMEQVLSEMRRRGNINEIIQQLQSIIERQEKLREDTEQRKLDELFEGLGTQ